MIGFRDDGQFERAIESLDSCDYTEAGIRRVLERPDILAVSSADIPRALRQTREPSPLNTLIRLFFLGVPVPEDQVRAALACGGVEPWIDGRLISRPGGHGQVAPLVQIWPVGKLRLAADLSRERTAQAAADFVMPPGPITMHLAHARIRRPCRSLLDLGSGCGVLGLLCADEAEQVTASDRNDRAAAFTRFNARLNRMAKVETLVGDGLEPVAGRRFDRILCNPPFVIGPTRRYLFRDSGMRGDQFCRRLLAEMAGHLEEGGFVQMTANLPHLAGRDWRADLAEWFTGIGGDALVLNLRTEDVSDYAMTWVVSTETDKSAEVLRHYDTWMDYFAAQGIEAVSYLLITVRRRRGADHWIQIDDPPCHVRGPCGEEVFAFFAARAAFGPGGDPADLLGLRLRLSPNVRIEQEHVMTPRGLEVGGTRLRKTGGLQYPLAADPNVARLLAGCDGTRTLGRQLDAMSAELEVDRARLLAAVAPVIRSLLERSVLMVAETGV